MNILLLAPHPFYQERGTPIAVDLLARALSHRGDSVDILTYHEGRDRTYDGPGRVRIFRIAAPPLCRGIRPGFSIKKVIADVWMNQAARRLARENRYNVVHAVEEAVFMAMRLRRLHGMPYICDMDSSMPRQIIEKMPWARPLFPLMNRFEARAVRGAAAVAAVCDALADVAREHGATNIHLLRDVPLLDHGETTGNGFRASLNLRGPTLLYIGNLEHYQGIDLLLESFALVPESSGAALVVVGGVEAHVRAYREKATALGIGARAHFTGPRPLGDMAALMAECDILVSPRTQGANTPMKIYSYMAAGKAIIATDLPTHTQALDPESALLVTPEPRAFAAGIASLLADPALRDRLGAAAMHAVETRYSLDVFTKTVDALYRSIPEVQP